MEFEKYQTLHAHVVKNQHGDLEEWRRRCGCLKTSDKLKELLKSFPGPPPPSPVSDDDALKFPNTNNNPFDINCLTVSKCVYPTSFAFNNHCISAACARHADRPAGAGGVLVHGMPIEQKDVSLEDDADKKLVRTRTWTIVADLVQLVQLSVTATALALYYLIYCYMQLVYYTLRSALYFHNADGPMKVTIGVVTITSVIVGFNLLIRMERLIGIF